ncbi:MAG: ankyrin repeat domain-containing protein [Psychrobium sp.]
MKTKGFSAVSTYLSGMLAIWLLLLSLPVHSAKQSLDLDDLSAQDHFLYAISQNNLGLAQQLLQQGVDINYRSSNRNVINAVNVRADRVNRFMGGKQRFQYASGTAYDIALSQAQSQTVKWLLQKGANPAAGFFKASIENAHFASFYPASFLNLPYRERAIIVSVGEVLALAVEENDVTTASRLLQISPRAAHYRGNKLLSNVLRLGKWQLSHLLLRQGQDLDKMRNLEQLLNYPLDSEPTNYAIFQDLLKHAGKRKKMDFYPFVMKAFAKEDSRALKMLIAAGATLNSKRKKPPLFVATEQDNLKNVQLLLSLGADPDHIFQLRSLLHEAVAGQKLTLARLFLQAGANANIKNRYDVTPLATSVHQKKPAMTMLLLEHGANANIVDHQLNSPLHIVVNEDKPFLLKEFIKRKVPVNKLNRREESALFIAVKNSELGMVKDLLKAGANPNLKNIDNESPLQKALTKKNLGYAQALIKAKADVNIVDGISNTPLMIATEQVRIPLMKLLLKAGAKVNAVRRHGAKTALYIAIQKSDLNMIRLLLNAKASVNIRTDQRQTALHLAVGKKHLGMVNLILQGKPQINVLDYVGETALHDSVRYKNLPVVKRLLQAGAQVNTINERGNTPLITALENRRSLIAQALIQSGANINVITNKRQTPLDIAIARGLPNVSRILVSKGAKTAEQIGSINVLNVKVLK